MNLELILTFATALTGIVWLVYALTHRGVPKDKRREPWYVEYSKSFFPVLLIVLVLRSFVAEPFRIPSGSMMPTLLVGDFILVNKFAYGLRLPVLHTKIADLGEPERGDVVVFRFPRNPEEDYIKRIVGLPGDRIGYFNKTVYINGEPMPQWVVGVYHGVGSGEVMTGAEERIEDLAGRRHHILIRPDRLNVEGEYVVPEGHYFVLGDNRDNSNDSRFWGFVPEENLVGKAFIIWLNWDISGGVFDTSRIGMKIQ